MVSLGRPEAGSSSRLMYKHGRDGSFKVDTAHVSPAALPTPASIPRSFALSPRKGGTSVDLDRPLPPLPLTQSRPIPVTMANKPLRSSSLVRRQPNFSKRESRDDLELIIKRSQQSVATKRMSRDDTFLRTQRKIFASSSNSRPSLERMPIDRTDFPIGREISVRIDTPESLRSAEIPIGMALGSPSHAPIDMSRWQTSMVMPALPEPEEVETSQQVKTPSRRRFFGLFGRKKSHETSDHVGSQPAHDNSTPLAAPPMMTGASRSEPTTAREPVTKTNTTANDRKAPRHKPIVIETKAEPFNADVADSNLRPMPPRFSLSPRETLPRGRMLSPLSLHPTQPPRAETPNASLMEINIPNERMERYSVMFSSVLGEPSKQPASSLLARRQATLEKLRTLKEGAEPLDLSLDLRPRKMEKDNLKPRPMSSPQFMESPSLLMPFPMPPAGRITPASLAGTPAQPGRKLSPLMRSKTAPGKLPSPLKSEFDFGDLVVPKGKHGATLTVPAHVSPSGLPPSYPPPSPPALDCSATLSGPFNPNESALFLDSPVETDDEDASDAEVVLSQTSFIPRKQPEPQWQMLTPPSSAGAGAAPSTANASVATADSSVRQRSESSNSSIATHETKKSALEIEEPDQILKTAVQVSIARQISISRQQRKMLDNLAETQTKSMKTSTAAVVPLVTMTITGGTSASSSAMQKGWSMSTRSKEKLRQVREEQQQQQRLRSQSDTKAKPKSILITGTPAMTKLGSNEKMKDGKAAKPKVVHPDWEIERFKGDLQHRKSARAVVEGT